MEKVVKTNFKEIFSNIKSKLNITTSYGYCGDDFIQDTITFRVVSKISNTRYKYSSYIKISESEDCIFEITKYIREKLEIDTFKPLWRLNDKRVRHGLKSWI